MYMYMYMYRTPQGFLVSERRGTRGAYVRKGVVSFHRRSSLGLSGKQRGVS